MMQDLYQQPYHPDRIISLTDQTNATTFFHGLPRDKLIRSNSFSKSIPPRSLYYEGSKPVDQSKLIRSES